MAIAKSPWMHGRSIRNNRGHAVLPTVDGTTNAPHPAARAWLEAARHEFASIASFRHVARSLLALNAPNDLVDRAVIAADDERHHTKICLDLAIHAGAESPRIATDVDSLASAHKRPDDLVTTARSALLDGVVAEGFVAARLELTAPRCNELEPALSRMAADEQRHYELGVDIVRWCVEVRPWIVDQLKLALDDVNSHAPVDPQIAALNDSDRSTWGLPLDADITSAWATAMTNARDLVANVRRDVTEGIPRPPSVAAG